jgi:hypothetical protein
VTQALRRHVRTDGCRVIAVDNSAAMVERCREYLNGQDSMFQELLPVEVIEGDILALEFQPASVVALNFTLQFIAPEQRLALLGAHPPVAAARRRADPLGKAALQRPKNTRCSPTCTSRSNAPTATANWKSPRSAAPSKTS